MTEGKQISCIAIDDEPMALKLLEQYIGKVPFLQQAGLYRDAFIALNDLHDTQAELIFLDINMPDISGIQFLKTLTYKPLVIFTTAYSEYAVESYEFDAVDYLLKPIEFERFLKAVNKAYDKLEYIFIQENEKPVATKNDSILIKSGSDIHNINIEDILYIEGAGNYVTYVTANNRIMSLKSMRETQEQLKKFRFFRIHKSYIVSFKHIDLIETDSVRIGKKQIPIGESYRDGFRDYINSLQQ
ncbi:LytR/AlgR family response regulator transcription factor [candidate division KSB1 bacterium]